MYNSDDEIEGEDEVYAQCSSVEGYAHAEGGEASESIMGIMNFLSCVNFKLMF